MQIFFCFFIPENNSTNNMPKDKIGTSIIQFAHIHQNGNVRHYALHEIIRHRDMAYPMGDALHKWRIAYLPAGEIVTRSGAWDDS